MFSGDEDAFDVFEGKVLSDAEVAVPDTEIQRKRAHASRPSDQTIKKIKTAQVEKIEVKDEFETEAATEYAPAHVDAETGKTAGEGEQLQKLVLAHAIRHQVALPPDYDYVPIQQHKPLDPPNRTYPFKLDPFQATAIASIERNESVLVAAHTSAGKTVIAEYAIATALKNKQRVIYTSPIKALSNQKYREMAQEFGDVGLMTGDITINPSATCLVMTTEILRSMMYRGSEIMREVAWVIFDEIHYMRDKSRGVVWEETIILLPHKVRHVFLSATIPNAKQFAEWICRIHHQPCHVVYTDFRPVPLQHYVFPAGGDGIHLCVDEKGQFREQSFLKAVGSLTSGPNSNERGRRGGKKDVRGQTDLFKIIKMIWSRNYQPVIVFSFSKRDCESFALQMAKLNFNDDTEKELVTTIYNNAMAGLSDDDRQLPQIQHLLPLLQRGIGIHHSGLLQILKEVIEILFQEGLIKVLFATETFSIGLNMPAKTVVFTSVTKWDGKETRPLGSGEYIQMSGRAGRRGLDDRGIVIMMMDQQMEPDVARTMLKGEPDVLNSAFHLTYSMILNLMRVEGISPEYILERSFFQFQNSEALPAFENKLLEYEQEKAAIVIEDEATIAEYHSIVKQMKEYAADIRQVVTHPSYCLPYMQPGRLIQVKVDGADYKWCILVNFSKKTIKKPEAGKPEFYYILDVLCHCAEGYSKQLEKGTVSLPPPCDEDERGEMLILPINLKHVQSLSSIRVHLPKDLRSADARLTVLKTLNEAKRRFDFQIPVLDPISDMNIKDEGFVDLVKKKSILGEKLKENPLSQPDMKRVLDEKYAVYMQKVELGEKVQLMKKEIKQARSILQLDELKCRKRVLRRLGYTNDDDVVDVKGRVACELTTGDELVLAEMLFNGVFNDLTVEQTVALLSCFVCQEKSSDESLRPRPDMETPLKVLRETARKVAKVSIESKLELDEEEYVQSFLDHMVNPVYAWAEGAKFSDVCKMTDIFEGSVIRIIRRLEELLRQMVAASKQIGNAELEKKFTEGSTKIKRDIVFAASLYL